MDNSGKIIPLDDIVVVTKADSGAIDKVTTDVVDSDDESKKADNDLPKDDDINADDDVDNDLPKDDDVDNDLPKDDDIVGLNVDIHDLPAIHSSSDAPSGELIDSDIREDDDIKRDEFLSQTRDICDSADYGVDVKMPMLKGRHSYRSAVFSFIKLNPQFLSKKYSNLRLDSLNNELCDEVKFDMFSNIKSTKPQTKQVVGGFVETGKGYKVMENF